MACPQPFLDVPTAGTVLGFQACLEIVTGLGMVYLVAARCLPLGPVTTLRETSVIFGAVLGTIVLKEGFGLRRISASILVTVGIALLAVVQ